MLLLYIQKIGDGWIPQDLPQRSHQTQREPSEPINAQGLDHYHRTKLFAERYHVQSVHHLERRLFL